MLSIIIPTYNSAHCLEKTLLCFKELALDHELIVVDAGSEDGTVGIANNYGAKLVTGFKGRGQQLKAGAKQSKGNWLLFLHSDTVLDDHSHIIITDFMKQQKAGYFKFALDDRSPQAQRLEKMVAWRCEKLNLPYGDQGLLISKNLYEKIGGYSDIPLMEDVDIIRRLGKDRMVPLDCRATTSADKYRQSGYLIRSMRNLICLSLFYLGISPATIAKIYGK